MGGGSDVAIETAAITLMRHGLMGVADALAISRATLLQYEAKLLGAFIYNSIVGGRRFCVDLPVPC